MTKLGIWLMLLICTSGLAIAQKTTLSLDEAYTLLEEQYPALKSSDVLEELYQRKLENIDKGRLPDIYIKGDSRLQSENLTITGEPGAPVPFEFALPLWTARGYVEVQYNLLNGKANNTRQTIEAFDLRKDLQEIEVDRYGLQGNINELFINITLLREQQKLYSLSLNDLETRLEVVQAGIDNGVTLSSEADKIRVRLLELYSARQDLSTKESGLIATLEQMIDTDLTDSVEFIFPDLGTAEVIPDISRPEQDLFQLQRESLLARSDMIDLERRPYLGLFGQAGAGYPNPVNFFDTGFAPYGLVGINFSWKLTDWKKGNLDKELLRLQAQQINYAEETFEFNLKNTEQNYLSEIQRLQNLMETDETIASLQSSILQQMSAQLDEGVITSADYLVQANAELQARQSLAIHRIQLLQIQLDFWNSRGSLK